METTNSTSVIAILCGDLHLSHTPPVARSQEPDWYSAMWRSLRFLGEVAELYNAPILCAGDVFHTWRSPVELVNWAAKAVPRMYAIPGQHDLPFHDLQQIKKSPFWSLVMMGVIEYLPPGIGLPIGEDTFVYGFPWGVPITEPMPCDPGVRRVAVVHDYVWTPRLRNTSFPGAPKEKTAEVRLTTTAAMGYDLLVFGDNHRPFNYRNRLFNCGGFLRRNYDERDHRPSLGLLRSDGTIGRVPIPTEEDAKMVDSRVVPLVPDGAILGKLEAFLDQLTESQRSSPDFVATVGELLRAAGDELGAGVRRYIQEALDARKGSNEQ